MSRVGLSDVGVCFVGEFGFVLTNANAVELLPQFMT